MDIKRTCSYHNCNKQFEVTNKNPNQKYCPPHSKIVAKDKNRIRTENWRKKWGIHNRKSLGTSSLGSHKNVDITEETTLIQKEKARLNL